MKKNYKQKKLVIAILAIIIVAASVFLVIKYAPTKKTMSAFDYFEVNDGDNQVLAITDDEKTYDAGIYDGDTLYLKLDYVEEYINNRFYYDSESDTVLYTTIDTTYTYAFDAYSYTDTAGKASKTDVPVLRKIDGVKYIDFKYVADRTNCVYTEEKEPSRVIISLNHDERDTATVIKNDAVRYRGGVKSPIIDKVQKDDKVYCLSEVDGWMKVTTKTGFTGYIQTGSLSDVYKEALADTFNDNITVRDNTQTICMTWFQTTNTISNGRINEYLADTKGLNVISPTWYSISSENGSVTSIADKSWVDNMHAKGLSVWPLIDDFDKAVDKVALFNSAQARKNLIDRLISDAVNFDYDGINLDIENVKAESAKGFLQFVRELSQECKKSDIILSIDNYTPTNFRKYYDLTEQSVYADYIIIMGYDEHWNGSEAGSVSSITFTKNGIDNALKLMPKGKVINAIPFYTRIWKESNGQTTGTAVSMQRAIDTATQNGAELVWDDETAQYYASYEVDGAAYKIWIEDENSLKKKLDVMKNAGIAGMSSWCLGQERNQVWDVVEEYVGN